MWTFEVLDAGTDPQVTAEYEFLPVQGAPQFIAAQLAYDSSGDPAGEWSPGRVLAYLASKTASLEDGQGVSLQAIAVFGSSDRLYDLRIVYKYRPLSPERFDEASLWEPAFDGTSPRVVAVKFAATHSVSFEHWLVPLRGPRPAIQYNDGRPPTPAFGFALPRQLDTTRFDFGHPQKLILLTAQDNGPHENGPLKLTTELGIGLTEPSLPTVG